MRRRSRGWGPGAGLLVWALTLWGCGDGVSTAGDFREDRVSEAGSFADGPEVPADALFQDLTGEALRAAVDERFSPARTLGYGPARDALYRWDADADGVVCGLYSDFCVALPPGDPSREAMARGINAEHVWPQSMGARAEPLRSDLHHLFPAREQVNSARGNAPFGEVPDREATAWYRDAESRSSPPRSDADAWAERGPGRWEPPESRKGDVARAVFYVVAAYPELAAPSFFRTMQDDLLAWHRADPPDAAERARSAWVAAQQGTENPFVLDPSLAPRIWATARRPPPGPAPPPPVADGGPPAPALWISEIHYDNAGQDVGEGVEVSGPSVASLDGWRLVLVNGTGGTIYDEVALSGRLDGPRWVPVAGLQNGSPDGVALVAPDGRVAEALAWEGTFSAAVGADLVAFRDLGASQASDTPVGTSLARTEPGGRWRLGPATPGR